MWEFEDAFEILYDMSLRSARRMLNGAPRRLCVVCNRHADTYLMFFWNGRQDDQSSVRRKFRRIIGDYMAASESQKGVAFYEGGACYEDYQGRNRVFGRVQPT